MRDRGSYRHRAMSDRVGCWPSVAFPTANLFHFVPRINRCLCALLSVFCSTLLITVCVFCCRWRHFSSYCIIVGFSSGVDPGLRPLRRRGWMFLWPEDRLRLGWTPPPGLLSEPLLVACALRLDPDHHRLHHRRPPRGGGDIQRHGPLRACSKERL